MARIVDLLLEAGPQGVTREELLVLARARIRETYSERQLDRDLERLGPRLVRDGARLRLGDVPPEAGQPPEVGPAPAAEVGASPHLRVAAFDIETTVELVPEQRDNKLRTIYQVAVRRIGPDAAWVSERPRFAAYVRLADEKLHLVHRREETLAFVVAAASPDAVFTKVADVLAGAHVVVSYNGTHFDFELLKDAVRDAGRELTARLRWADALMVAISLYELPLGHTLALAPLCGRLGWQGDATGWHDATFDSDLLVWLLERMAADVASLPPDVVRLLMTVTEGSAIWSVIRALAPELPAAAPHTDADVRRIVRDALGDRPGVRAVPRAAVQFLPPALQARDDPAAIDLSALLRAVLGERAEPREGQRAMLETLRRWVRAHRSGLLEAPTGVGKSFALLSVALEWLAADPQHRVLISTYTKQLQTQLRAEIARLDGAGVPGVLGHSDVVKGKANRLSLRALLFAIEDLTAAAIPAQRVRARVFARDARYRELVAYVLLRFLAAPALIHDWQRLSVDPQDFHPFVSEYIGDRLGSYVKHISQAYAGEMPHESGEPLSAHTSNVREALAARRLVIVNHALLLANRDDLADLGPNTLLLVDEAHVLEQATTEALSATFDWLSLESAVNEFDAWVNDQAASLADLRAVRDRLLEWLERGTLRRSVRTAFGHLPLDPGARSFGRKLVIASPLDGRSAASGLGGVRTELCAAANAIYGAARAVQTVPHGRSRIEEERRSTLENRLRTLQENLYGVVNRIGEIERDFSANWIVWAEELLADPQERLYETGQELRFRVVAAPLEVALHPEFVRLTQGTFPAVVYVSATLKVTGSFAFIRERLGLPAGLVEEDEVPTSFDFARQARLVAFSDFPSWQEHVDAACRSIAQQVHRFELEVARPGENGVMVMTTARATAAAIGAELERLRHNDGASYALHHQLVRGTWQAMLAFSGRHGETAAEAGVLVGTKGLWQGVDVADERVLRMIWINKLPFASPAEPLIAARMARIARRLADEDERFQDHIAATEEASRRYYLPLGAIELRQAVGRLIRTDRHRGVIVISDRKLDGPDRWRRRNREFFLGSLDPGLLRADPETDEGDGAGNVVTMAEGWRQMWEFFATGPEPLLSPARLAQFTTDDALDAHTQLPEVRNIRALRFGRRSERRSTVALRSITRSRGSWRKDRTCWSVWNPKWTRTSER